MGRDAQSCSLQSLKIKGEKRRKVSPCTVHSPRIPSLSLPALLHKMHQSWNPCEVQNVQETGLPFPAIVYLLSQRTEGMEQRNDSSDGGGKIKIGVCVMEKKVWCSPMEQILERLRAFGEFEIIIFGDKVILEDPIESWPLCDCLIAFYSAGYPLEKAEKYAALRRPFLVNELDPQYLLHDRSKVYEHLKLFGVPVPTYAVVRRAYPNQELNYFIEQDDFIEIHGKRFCKPFVEKPIDGDDHNIMIYYPSSAGGGMKELFRKVD